MTKETAKPVRKIVSATAWSGATGAAIVIANEYFLTAHPINAMVQSALIVLVVFIAGYFTSPGVDETVAVNMAGDLVTAKDKGTASKELVA